MSEIERSGQVSSIFRKNLEKRMNGIKREVALKVLQQLDPDRTNLRYFGNMEWADVLTLRDVLDTFQSANGMTRDKVGPSKPARRSQVEMEELKGD